MRSQTFPKFSQCGANCHTGSSVRHEPCQTIGGAAGSAGSMNVLWRRSASTIASWRVVPSGNGTFVDRQVLAVVREGHRVCRIQR